MPRSRHARCARWYLVNRKRYIDHQVTMPRQIHCRRGHGTSVFLTWSMLFGAFYQQIDRMGQNGENVFQALLYCFRAAWQVNNQCMPSCSRDASRKHPKGSMLEADCAHGFGYTRSFTFNDRLCRFWRHIARRQPGATCRENEVHLLFITPFTQRGLDLLALVGNDGPCTYDYLRQLRDHRANTFATDIFPGAFCATIADGKYTNTDHHCYPCGVNSRIIAPICLREP